MLCGSKMKWVAYCRLVQVQQHLHGEPAVQHTSEQRGTCDRAQRDFPTAGICNDAGFVFPVGKWQVRHESDVQQGRAASVAAWVYRASRAQGKGLWGI